MSKEEGLDRLYLSGVRRRKFAADKVANDFAAIEQKDSTNNKSPNVELISATEEPNLYDYEDERYYYVPGNTFVIPYTQIANINIFITMR